MLNEATAKNLVRKAHWADHVQLLGDGSPLFSWLDISPIDACNRACVFCPRVDPSIAPNQPKLFLGQVLAEKLAAELHELEYEGAVIFCGTGEPLLHPFFEDVVRPFKGLRCEVVTNGDRLTPEKVASLYEAGMSFINVSMYDGPHQGQHFDDVFVGVPLANYALRDRWHGPDEDYGLKLTNRAGTIHVGKQPAIDVTSPCFYPSYCLTLDWDGRALLCPQDWHRRVVFGNANTESLVDIWTSRAMGARRKRLLNGREKLIPCKTCNADGCLHGQGHVEAWEK